MEIHASFNLTYHSHYLLFLLFVSIIFLHSGSLCLGSGITSKECLEEEIQALLIFKKDLVDPSGRLSSWIGSYCCQWNGISCHNRTGHVAAIDLPNTYMDTHRDDQEWDELEYNRSFLGGKISPSLVGLKRLNYLDLSDNDFGGISIPKFFCQLKSLRYLNISGAAFGLENVPPCLGNLSNLNSLDLSWNSGFNSLPSKNLNWLSHLSFLKYLHLDGMNLDSKGPSFLHSINMLPYLLEIHLSRCKIRSLPLSLRALNFTSLVVLDMSDNSINSSIPQWVSNLTNLRHLDLSLNQLSGSFPSEFAPLKSLEFLDLSINGLDGEIPISIGNLCNLKIYNLGNNNFNGGIGDLWDGLSNCTDRALESLDLSYNQLTGELPGTLGILQNLHYLQLQKNYMNGSIPQSLGQLSKLVELDLSDNSWDGFLTEAHFINLTRLESMRITVDSNVSLSFNVSYDWIPPFKLHSLQIANCRVGPGFGVWLQSQTQLTELTLRNTSISDSIPEDWFVKIASQVSGYFDLSYNQFRGTLPPQLKFQTGAIIILSHNQFEGPFPLWSTNSPVLDLESNLLSGPIPSNFGQLFPGMVELYLAENRLNGTIPPSICDMQSLEVLSLRNNQLIGEFPPRWSAWSQISIVDVSNNNLSGNIPSSVGVPSSLLVLKMNGNNFGGEIPSLKNCSSLTSIDLGENRLTGNIAHLFMGSNISVLFMLRLRSNSLSGPIPKDLCHLLYLQILDLGRNNISGTIPKCLNSSTLLSLSNSSMSFLSQNYPVQTVISTKGAEYVFNETLGLVKSIDLSSNNLEGEIPEGLTTLIALGTLNLSRNQLTGSIPSMIGNLRWLETFDLSYNHLSGQIPQSLASLTSLSHLNLSYNNLSGRIPVGNQLGTLENPASIYVGNPSLCGVPLSTNCSGDDTPSVPSYGQEPEKDENGKKVIWFYANIAFGFIIGFWGVCGTLILKKSWRYAYFQFVDDMNDKVALAIASKVARLRRKL